MRQIFLDSSKIEEIDKWSRTGVISGVTSNQMIMLKDGVDPNEFDKHIKRMCNAIDGPVSVELTDSTAELKEMVEEAKRLRLVDNKVVIKVPLIPETTKSLEVVKTLVDLDIPVNITCMMTFEQMLMAILAARKSKLAFVSLFWARTTEDHDKYRSNLDWVNAHVKVGCDSEVNSSAAAIMRACVDFLKEGNYEQPKIITGSIRNARQAGEAFNAGSDIVTITPDVLTAMLYSERTKETIKEFDEAWISLKQGVSNG